MRRLDRWLDGLADYDSRPYRFDVIYEDVRNEFRYRAMIVFFVNTFGMFATLILGTIVLRDGYRILAIADYSASFCLLISTLILVFSGRTGYAVNLSLGSSVILFSMFIFIGGENNSTALWFNTYPVQALFLAGKRRGTVYSAVLLTLAVIMLFTPAERMLHATYVPAFKLRILLTYVLVFYVAYVYESLRLNNSQRLRHGLQEMVNQKKKLEQTNNELEAFARIASHQLREPVRKLSVTVSRWQRQADRTVEFAEKLCRDIGSNIDRLTSLLWGLDAYSAVGRGTYAPHPVDLQTVCEHAVRDLDEKGMVGEADIRLQGLPVVLAEPEKMAALFFHLLRNSLMYGREGVPTRIVIRGAEARGNGNGGGGRFCLVEVADNGQGLMDGTGEKPFLPFQRLHHAGRQDNIGLGLTLCRRIVQRHGGEITIANNREAGALVRISLPLPDTVAA